MLEDNWYVYLLLAAVLALDAAFVFCFGVWRKHRRDTYRAKKGLNDPWAQKLARRHCP